MNAAPGRSSITEEGVEPGMPDHNATSSKGCLQRVDTPSLTMSALTPG